VSGTTRAPREAGSLAEAHRTLIEHVVWPHFWAVQIWVLVLFLMYCSLRDLIRALGPERVRGMFLGGAGSAPTSGG
jgi:hypothetical protein